MPEHDETRRAFLVGTAVGAAGATLIPKALAQDSQQPHQHSAAPPSGAPQAAGHAMNAGHGAFLSDDDTVTMTALTERLMPGAPGKPGATDAAVVNYIDLALAGAYADEQDFYRRALVQLDAHCAKTYGKPFHRLTAAQQDETIAALEQGKAPEFVWPTAQAFFNTLRTHTMEGMFADPIYGGNKDFAGWRLIGFPGAQPLYTPEDMVSTQAFSREPMIGLQSRAKKS